MAIHDPGNQYAVPYMWTTTGLGYNVDLVRARLGAVPPDRLGLLLDRACRETPGLRGITIVDSRSMYSSPRSFISAAIRASSTPRRRGRIRGAAQDTAFVRYMTPPIHREISPAAPCAFPSDGRATWSRPAPRERGVDRRNIAYLVPREGALMTVDMMAIPADARIRATRRIWINYLLRPDVIAGITNSIRYPNGNSASLPFVERHQER